MITFKNILISLLLMVAIGLSSWSLLSSHGKQPVEMNPLKPDAFMEDVVATTFNKQGKPSLMLVTPKMIHYPNHDMTKILLPKVTIYRQSPNPWLINSNYATASQGINQILFQDHVVIFHPADKDDPTTTMKTSALTVFPNKQIAETDQPVVITQPNTTIQAIGMLADLNIGIVKLLSQAKGIYVPSS